jgi:hypothetical protein
VSTHNPLGVTFAAGVYASIFGSSKEPINSYYAKKLFYQLKESPHRQSFKVIVGGSGGWQIVNTNTFEELSVDCVVDGRSESVQTLELFRKAISGEDLPRQLEVSHPRTRDGLLVPNKRTTFGVVEMTTGCGRRCNFCMPDLNPQLDMPKEKIMTAVRANVEQGNTQISLATEDMFIWGQVGTSTPFYFPNREALLDLYSSILGMPGVNHHVLSHATMAPSVVDPKLIEQLSALMLDKSPVRIPQVSSHPEGRVLSPLIGMETASVRMAKMIMPGKSAPFPIDEWPSVLIRGLEVLNKNNWFPVITLMVGNPGETDEDVKATLDVVYEIERRKLFAILVPSIFTPLNDTRMADKHGTEETRDMTPLQWQLIMKCWKMSLNRALQSWWGPTVWRIGALVFWAWKLRKTNGPHFKWPMFMFASALPEWLMEKMGKIYRGKPMTIKTRAELLKTIKPQHWKYLRADNGDLPGDPPAEAAATASAGAGSDLLRVLPVG